MSTNDGGPVFPRETYDNRSVDIGQCGVSLRDYFATKMVGPMLEGATNLGEATPEERTKLFDSVAQIIYEIADAMLRARA